MGQTKRPSGESDRRRCPRLETVERFKLGLRAQDFDLVGEVWNLSWTGAYISPILTAKRAI
jgi:hypothetical protein